MALNPSILKEIIIDVASGESIRRVLDKHNINQYEFYEYLAENPSQQALYDKAQIYKAHGLVDDTIDIADNEIDHVRARNKIATRQWFAAKIYPARYSDRIDINVKTIDITGAFNQADARLSASMRTIEPRESVESDTNIDSASSSDLLPMCYPENAPHSQPIDITKQNSIDTSGYKPEIPAISNTSDPKKSEDDDIFS